MDTTHLEDRISHLTRAVEDLSDVVARHEREMALMTRRLAWLTEREAEREDGPEGGEAAPGERPPHW